MKQALKWGVIVTATLRIGLGLAMAAAWITAKPHLLPVIQNTPSPYGKLVPPSQFPGDALLTVWVRWDAVHHLNLAMLGYLDVSEGDSVFYPLYALVTRLFANFLGGNHLIGGLLVSTTAALASFVLLYRLAEASFDRETAIWSVVALAAFPTSFFLIAPFTESLFLVLTLSAFWFAYARRWELVGIAGFLASLTRGPGILSVLPLAVIAWRHWRETPFALLSKQTLRVSIGLALPFAGGVAFQVWRSYVGFPPISAILEAYSGLRMTNPVHGLSAAVLQWVQDPGFANTLEIITAFGFILATGFMVKKFGPDRPEWLIYTVLNLGLFLSKKSFIASSLQSMPRYVLILFPVFLFLGSWLARQSNRTRFVYLTSSSTALLFLSICYSLWIFVG